MKSVLQIVFILFSFQSFGQIGGQYVYDFLGLPASARLTALGSTLISVEDDDINLASSNPALLNSDMHKSIAFNYDFLFADIGNAYMAYGHHFDSLGISGHLAINYANYGEFTTSDIYGNSEGTFKGKETAIILGASKNFDDRMSVGLNVKGIFGSIESYNSFGIAADIGLKYQPTDPNTTIGVAIRNIGTSLSHYGEEGGMTPVDIQVGISRRLKYIPFRFSVTAHHLNRWSITYDDPNAETDGGVFGEEGNESSTFEQGIDNFFRHLIFGGEFLLGKGESFRLRVGYNHLRRKELSVSDFRSLAGFSGGFGLSIKGFRLDYGLGYHHLVGASNHLSLSTNLNRYF